VDVRIALTHQYPRLRRSLGRPVALGGLPASSCPPARGGHGTPSARYGHEQSDIGSTSVI
jgi:hypothetical protein